MPVNYDEFLNCAYQFIQRGNPTEMDLRNSTSRAYYYLFHKIRETFRDHPKANFRDGPGDHKQIVVFLIKINKGILANRVHQCYNLRNIADYEIKVLFSRKKAYEQLKEVKSISKQINALPTS